MSSKFWRTCTLQRAQMMAVRALQPLRKKAGGPFSRREIRQLIQDLLDLPHEAGVRNLSKLGCRNLVYLLLVRGLIVSSSRLYTRPTALKEGLR